MVNILFNGTINKRLKQFKKHPVSIGSKRDTFRYENNMYKKCPKVYERRKVHQSSKGPVSTVDTVNRL